MYRVSLFPCFVNTTNQPSTTPTPTTGEEAPGSIPPSSLPDRRPSAGGVRPLGWDGVLHPPRTGQGGLPPGRAATEGLSKGTHHCGYDISPLDLKCVCTLLLCIQSYSLSDHVHTRPRMALLSLLPMTELLLFFLLYFSNRQESSGNRGHC